MSACLSDLPRPQPAGVLQGQLWTRKGGEGGLLVSVTLPTVETASSFLHMPASAEAAAARRPHHHLLCKPSATQLPDGPGTATGHHRTENPLPGLSQLCLSEPRNLEQQSQGNRSLRCLRPPAQSRWSFPGLLHRAHCTVWAPASLPLTPRQRRRRGHTDDSRPHTADATSAVTVVVWTYLRSPRRLPGAPRPSGLLSLKLHRTEPLP